MRTSSVNAKLAGWENSVKVCDGNPYRLHSSHFTSVKDSCSSGPCQNEGLCENVVTDGSSYFKCTCQMGWEGATCVEQGEY